jgi:hypothetical protein
MCGIASASKISGVISVVIIALLKKMRFENDRYTCLSNKWQIPYKKILTTFRHIPISAE